jgi:hypothetical protein
MYIYAAKKIKITTTHIVLIHWNIFPLAVQNRKKSETISTKQSDPRQYEKKSKCQNSRNFLSLMIKPPEQLSRTRQNALL